MASQLEGFVNSVVSLSTDGNYAQLCEEVTKCLELLRKNAAYLDTVLETLDPQLHSIGVLAILNVKFQVATSPSATEFETLFSQTQLFFSTCNGEQVRFTTESYASLAHHLTKGLIQRNQAIRGITILRSAISRIQIHPGQLTSLHADLCQLCLKAKCLKPALPVLDADITEISKEGGHFDSTHFLCYYYYGGMIYTALKNWDRAGYFFEVAITTPSMAVSHIMLEAYKKFILVCLIQHGKVPNLPKYTSQVVNRFIKITEAKLRKDSCIQITSEVIVCLSPSATPLSQLYQEIANSYSTNNPSDVSSVLEKHSDQLNRDQNMGLGKQVVSSLYRKNIQRLTKTFLTLSLSDIARRVHLHTPQEAEQYVRNMIEDGEIHATISKQNGMVHFHDNPEKYDNPAVLRHVEQQMQHCISLDEKLKSMDQEIAVNPQYVQKSMGVREDDEVGGVFGGK